MVWIKGLDACGCWGGNSSDGKTGEEGSKDSRKWETHGSAREC